MLRLPFGLLRSQFTLRKAHARDMRCGVTLWRQTNRSKQGLRFFEFASGIWFRRFDTE